MKTLRKRTVLFLSLSAGALVLLQPGSARALPHGNEWTTAMVKMEMWTTAGVPSVDIYVDTVDGRVVLSGKVETQAEREAAEKVANTIEGVIEVRNLLQVVPARIEKSVARDDKAIEEGVKKAFSSERALAGSRIAIGSVSHGLVLLTGDAATFSEHLFAVETARLVKGVRSVATQVKGPQGLSEDEIVEGEAMRVGRDIYITTAVKLRLFADRSVPALDIKVDTRNGMVVLFGTVPTAAAKSSADRIARKVKGVDRVINDLQVVAAEDRRIVDAKDDFVELAVGKALKAREELSDVSISVKKSVVRLTGSVASVPAKLRATLIAGATSGVRSVENDVQVKRRKQ